MGLLTAVVPAEQVLPAAQELASRLAAGPTVAYAALKQSLHLAATSTLAEALAEEDRQQARAGDSADHAAAVRSVPGQGAAGVRRALSRGPRGPAGSGSPGSGPPGPAGLDPAGEPSQREPDAGREQRADQRPADPAERAERQLEVLAPHELRRLRPARPHLEHTGAAHQARRCAGRRSRSGGSQAVISIVSRKPIGPNPVNASIPPPTPTPSCAVPRTRVPSIHSPCPSQSTAPAQVASAGASTGTCRTRVAVIVRS